MKCTNRVNVVRIGIICIIAIAFVGCGKNTTVSFDSAEGLTKKQLENAVATQTDEFGADAESQADQIYEDAKEKGTSGFDSLMTTTDNILQGKTHRVDLQKLTKNGLYYFLVVKQYLYEHFMSVLLVWWMIVGLSALFFRLKNRATEKAIISVLGFGGTLVMMIIVFSPI